MDESDSTLVSRRPNVNHLADIRTSMLATTEKLTMATRSEISISRSPEKVSTLCYVCSRFKMHSQAAIARLLLIMHGVACLAKASAEHKAHWILITPLAALPIEAWITWKANKGKEWKWFCPCVLLYLCSVIPSVWFMEMDLVLIFQKSNNTTEGGLSLKQESSSHAKVHKTSNKSHALEKALFGMDWTLRQETFILEQLLLFVLIIARWILPRGNITQEQKSGLLMTYIGMAADILELQEPLKDPTIQTQRNLVMVLLTIWTSSVLQFTFVFTARKDANKGMDCILFETEMWAILLNLVLQDAPFLIIRIYMLTIRSTQSQSSIFFLVKNLLITCVIIYRVYTIMKEEISAHKQRRERALKVENEMMNTI